MIKARAGVRDDIVNRGFALVRRADFQLDGWEEPWRELADDWDHLETDVYMSDNGRYRLRRYGRFRLVPEISDLRRLPHATVFQSKGVNKFAGGMHRDFAPLRESTFANPCLLSLIRHNFDCFDLPDERMRSDSWEVWIHQIRIQVSATEVGRPAPEGIHHDGHDFIAMHLVGRNNVAGGQSMIYDNSQNPLFQCLLEEPLDTIYANDHRVMHNVEPITARDANTVASRDVLIIDYDHKPGLSAPA